MIYAIGFRGIAGDVWEFRGKENDIEHLWMMWWKEITFEYLHKQVMFRLTIFKTLSRSTQNHQKSQTQWMDIFQGTFTKPPT